MRRMLLRLYLGVWFFVTFIGLSEGVPHCCFLPKFLGLRLVEFRESSMVTLAIETINQQRDNHTSGGSRGFGDGE